MSETKDYNLGARFTKEEVEAIKNFAKKRKISVSNLLREAIFSHMYFLDHVSDDNIKQVEKIEISFSNIVK